MKKLLLILLCLPFIGFGQGCNYGESTNDLSVVCDLVRSLGGNNFATDRNADISLDKILDVTGMSKRFVLKECSNISNCVATSYKGIRYILYDKDFMEEIATRTNSWSNLSILAHEIGHHVNGHSLDILLTGASEKLNIDLPTLSEQRQLELEADEYSGFVMYKLGASLSQSQEAIYLISTNDDDSYSTHPSRDKRLKAIERGYNKAKGQGSNNDYLTNSSTLFADDYFYKAYNSLTHKDKITYYTKCLEIDPNFKDAHFLRHQALENISDNDLYNYINEIDNLKNNTDAYIYNIYALALNERVFRGSRAGDLAWELWDKDSEPNLKDINYALELNPTYADAQRNIAYLWSQLNYISSWPKTDKKKSIISKRYNKRIESYLKAIKLYPNFCDVYYKLALEYSNEYSYRNSKGNSELALNSINQAINCDPNNAFFYLARAVLKKGGDRKEDLIMAIKLEPNLHYAYYLKGDYDLAIKSLEDETINVMLDRYKMSNDYKNYKYNIENLYYNSRGERLVYLGKYEDALSDFTYTDNLLAQADVFFKMEKYDDALKILNRNVKQMELWEEREERGICLVYRSLVHKKLGNNKAAITDLKEFNKMDGKLTFTYYLLSQLYKKKNKQCNSLEKACKYSKDMIKEWGDSIENFESSNPYGYFYTFDENKFGINEHFIGLKLSDYCPRFTDKCK